MQCSGTNEMQPAALVANQPINQSYLPDMKPLEVPRKQTEKLH